MKAFSFSAFVLIFLFDFLNAQIITFHKAFGYSDGSGQWLDNAGGVFFMADSSYLVMSFSLGLDDGRTKVVTNGFLKEGMQNFENSFGADSTYYYIGEAGTAIKTYQGDYALAGNGGKNLIDSWGTLWIFNSEGDSVFEREYGSLGESDTLENFYDLVQLPDSGYMMVGWQERNPDIFPIPDINPNLYLIRTDKSGNLLWEKIYDQSFSDQGNHIEMFDSTHVIIAGYKQAYNSPTDTPWVFVADLEGIITKERSFTDQPYNCFYFIGPRLFRSIDGNFFFTGCLNGAIANGAFDYPEFIAKMDTNLDFVWETDFNTANQIYIYHAEQIPDSSIMIVGVQIDSVNGRVWGWVSKLDNNGSVIWDRLYKQGNSLINYLFDIDQTYDCGFVVSGSMNTGDQQSWLLKMDRFGCIDPVCDTLPGSCGSGIPTNSSQSQSVSTLDLDVSLYPNPADEELHVFYNLPHGTATAQLLIFDINGRIVLEQRLSHSSHDIQVAVRSWAPGMYVCRIRTVTGELTKKIMVGR